MKSSEYVSPCLVVLVGRNVCHDTFKCKEFEFIHQNAFQQDFFMIVPQFIKLFFKLKMT